MQQIFGELRSLPPCDPERSSPPRSGQAAQSRDLLFLVERAMRREYHFYVYTMQSASRRGLYYRHDQQLGSPCLAAQNPCVRGFHGRLPRRPPRILAELRRCLQSHQSRKAAEELAAGKEPAVDRNHEPALARPCCRLVRNCSDRAEAGITQGPSTVAPVHLVNERPRSG
jgi:hypothetical protein